MRPLQRPTDGGANPEMTAVRLQISPTPAHVRTVRLVTTAVARLTGLSDSVLDEVRLAVGEACSRAVGLHQVYAPAELITVLIEDEGKFVITVCDAAPSGAETGYADPLEFLAGADSAEHGDADSLPSGLGMAVIEGLVDDLEILPVTNGPGTIVRMTWPLTATADSGFRGP